MADQVPLEFDATRKTVKALIREHQCQFAPNKAAGWVWGYAVQKDEQAFSVYQRTGRPDALFISLSADISDYNHLIESLPPKDRDDLLFDLRFALLACDVEFDIPNNAVRDSVLLTRQLFVEDGITRTVFWDKVFAIHKATLALVWTIERRIPLQ